MWSRRFIWRCWLWLALCPALAQADGLLQGTVESLRDADSPLLGGVPLWSGAVLAEFYWSRDYEPAWTRSADLDALLHAIEESPADGLDPADFHVQTVHDLSRPGALERLGRAERLAADIELSDALLRYIHQIRFGRLDPILVNRFWNHRPPVSVASLVGDMGSVLQSKDPVARLAELAPKPFFYENLKRALRDYGGGARLRDLPPIPGGGHLTQGSRDPRVPQIRARLELLGDHRDPPPAEPERFDDSLRASLKAFQSRVGLTPDGVAGPSTIAALNRPYDAAKVEQIRINLERMRWFYDGLPQDYVLVDVAGFMVYVVRGGQVDWSTRVVVGTPQLQTPSFRDEMEHVVFNPTWTVPPSIQKKMRGAGRFRMVDRRTGRAVSGGNASDFRRYSLIQPAGPRNALGRVKFIFPNNQSVYLHDTPSKSLFGSSVRAFSHGCVRVQNPTKLAEVILNQPNWDQAQINRVIASNRTRYVILEERLPVLLYYLTATADAEGRVSFRRDIYGRDAGVRAAFAGEPSKARITFEAPAPVAVPRAVPVESAEAIDAADAADAANGDAAGSLPTLIPAPIPAPAQPAGPAVPRGSPPAFAPPPLPVPRIEAAVAPVATPRSALTLDLEATRTPPALALPRFAAPGTPRGTMEREAASRL